MTTWMTQAFRSDMKCEPCTYSQASAEDCLQTSFWDTDPSLLSSGTHFVAESYANEQQTDGSQDCKCGKEMSDCLIHPSTPGEWTAFMQDSLAQMYRRLGQNSALLMEPAQVFTARFCESLASLDPDKSFWRTYQPLFQTDSPQYCGTWPRWGMTLDGVAYRHPMSEQIIEETGGGFLPTPTASQDYKPIRKFAPSEKNGTHGRMLVGVIGELYPELVGQYLNPKMVEWLMGFPTGWTDLRQLETPKSHCKPQSPTNCSEAEHD